MTEQSIIERSLELSPTAMVTFNHQGDVLYANAEAEKQLGGSKLEMAQMLLGSSSWPITDFAGKSLTQAELPFAQALRAQGPVYNLEHAVVRPDGTRRYLSLHAAPIINEAGRVKGVTMTFHDASEQIQVTEQLKARELRHKNIYDHLMDEVHVWQWILDEQGNLSNWVLVDANASALKNWGQALDEVVGKTATEIFGQEAHGIFKPIIEKLIRTGEAQRWDVYFPPTSQYLSMDSILVGEYFISTGRDITDTKRYQQELTAAKEHAERAEQEALRGEMRLKNSHSMAKLGGWEFDVATGVFSFTDNFYEVFRSSVDEVGGYTMTAEEYTRRFVHPDDREVVGSEIGKALATDDPDFSASLEHRMVYEDGEIGYLAVRYFIIKDGEGNTITLYGVNQDITHRKRIEEDLTHAKKVAEANEARYSGLLSNLDTGVVVHAADTSIMICNPRSSELLGLSEAQMKGKVAMDPYWKFIDENRNTLPLDAYPVMRVLNTQAPLTSQMLGVCQPNQEVTWLLVNGIPVKTSQGEVKEVIISFQDITDRKVAEEELWKAKEQAEESDQLKTAFLQNLSHEIRTPLNAICGFTQLLSEQDLNEATKIEYTALIQSSSDQLLSIISDVLAISTLETGQERVILRPTNVNTLLKELQSIFRARAQAKGLTLQLGEWLPDAKAEVATDEIKLRQVLSNLLANALKFTDSGVIEYGCHITAGQLEFYVKDEGIGILLQHQEKIFERFKQADDSIAITYGGTGLGLSISKAYVELLGGKIGVDSTPNQGATFRFTTDYLPVAPNPELPPGREYTPPSQRAFTLLVAEDQMLNFKVIEGMLKDTAVKLLHARDGQEAVAHFEANPAINLILMDVKMPNLAGDEAAKVIKGINANVPIIAQSGYALVQEKAQYAGIFDEYLTKPIDAQTLKDTIMKYIGAHNDALND